MEHKHTTDIDCATRVANGVTVGPAGDTQQAFNIRRALYSLRSKDPQNQQTALFLSVEPDYHQTGHWISFPKIHAEESSVLLEGLPMYLVKWFGGNDPRKEDAIAKLLTYEALERYNDMAWDEETQKATTADDRYYEEALQDFNSLEMSWMGGGTLEEFMDEAGAATKRPLPLGITTDFDNASIGTTGTNLTQKAALAEVQQEEYNREEETAHLSEEDLAVIAAAKAIKAAAVLANQAAQTSPNTTYQDTTASLEHMGESAPAAATQAAATTDDGAALVAATLAVPKNAPSPAPAGILKRIAPLVSPTTAQKAATTTKKGTRGLIIPQAQTNNSASGAAPQSSTNPGNLVSGRGP